MYNEKAISIKIAAGKALKKLSSDFFSILVFLYTPIDLLVKLCRTFRERLLSGHANEDLYQSRQFEHLLKRIICGSDSVFKDRLLRAVALLSTLVLQFISFFTTLAGVSYYFSSISPYAPLALAFTIQFLFYILCNFGRGKRKFTLPRRMMLACVFLISMLFSYIGIVNGYVPPVKTFEQRYTAYYNAYDDAYRQVTQTFKQNLASPLEQLDLLYENAARLCAQADLEIAACDEKLAALAGVKDTVRTGRNQWGYSTYETNPAYEEAQSEMRQFENQRNSLAAGRNRLQAGLDALVSDGSVRTALEAYLKDGQVTPEMVRINRDYTGFAASYNQLLSTLSFQAYEALGGDLIRLADQYAYHTEALALKPQSFQELTDALGTAADTVSNEYLYRLTSMIEHEVVGKYDRLLLLAHDALPEFDGTQVAERYQELIPLPDINLLALEKLLPSSGFFRQAMVALFLALLVDGMTVLIPLFIQKRPCSVLSLKGRRHLSQSEEELLERIMLSVSCVLPAERPGGADNAAAQTAAATAVEAEAEAETFDKAEASDAAKRRPVVLRFPAAPQKPDQISRCVDMLGSYFALFHSSPWTNDVGYSKYLTEQELNAQGSPVFNHLTDILCSLQYLVVVSEYEYRSLTRESQNIPDALPPEEPPQDPGQAVYLMRKNFDLWLAEKLSGLLQFKPSQSRLEI